MTTAESWRVEVMGGMLIGEFQKPLDSHQHGIAQSPFRPAYQRQVRQAPTASIPGSVSRV
jgi:hypothetical protein